ncbi:MAG TPA: hypothetical protein VHD14_10595 [Pseudolabrys sp.]|nr:hypothetical protein [Pseudolabrys sp.]
MVIIVNGYICASSCEAAKARHGQDPRQQPGQLPGTDSKKASGLDNQPAVTFGGSLKNSANSNGAISAPGTSAAPSATGNSVNLLV